MKQKRNHVLSFLTLLLFSWMAISSGGLIPFAVNFNSYGLKEAQEGSADQRNYLLKSDGTKIYGNKIYWDKNDKNRYQIFIDDSSYQISDVLACKLSNSEYYWKYSNNYILRIISGKISIYYMLGEPQTPTTTSSSQSYTYQIPYYFYQLEGEKNLMSLTSLETLQSLVKDCPAAFAKVNMKSKKLGKLIRRDPNYLNNVFEIYNHCK